MAELSLDDFKTYLPPYLSAQGRDSLYARLRDFPENQQEIYATNQKTLEIDSPLQGDGWAGFVAINFESLEKKSLSGIILSNSCDISVVNERALPVNLLFVPLIRVSAYAELLRTSGNRSGEAIASILTSIRKQQTTAVFYLPELAGVQGESMALLDDVHAHPLANFSRVKRSRIFRLSMYGFYLLLFKLSIHFMRMQEGVDR